MRTEIDRSRTELAFKAKELEACVKFMQDLQRHVVMPRVRQSKSGADLEKMKASLYRNMINSAFRHSKTMTPLLNDVLARDIGQLEKIEPKFRTC